MPEVASARTETYATHLPAALSTAASVSKAGSDMKNNGKDKTLASDDNQKELVQKEEQEEEATKSEAAVDPSLNADLKATEKQEKNINGRGGSNSDTESGPIDTPIFAGEANQDAEMREASPTPADVTEQDMPMMEAAPLRETSGSGASEGISQEDLDGGLLDGALDDYDDLDQDTEDTEVGNGDDDFSDDDDDDDDDMDGRLLDSSNKPGPDDEMHSPATMSRADTVKSDDRDMDMHDDTTDHQDKETTLGHSDDSDSDLPEPEGSDNEHEDDEDEDDEEDEGEDDEMDEEDEEIMPVKKVPELKKDFGMSQKPILNRPPATEEELKDSGDELSDLSEFDDSDDSDEDDMPKIKVSNKEFVANSSSAATASTAQGNGKPEPGGRKRSVQDSSTIKQDLDSVKTEHEEQSEVPNGKARASDRKASEAEDTHHSDKESFSEAHGEEEEKVAEEEEEEEEDLEKKQLHKDALEALTSIEVEFANLRDKMYEERMMELDREVDMINAGTHPELSSLMQEIEHKREQRLRFAEMGKRYLIDIAESAYQVAEYRAHCTFQSSRRTTRTDMVRALGKKQRQIMMELTLSSETYKRRVIDDKATLVRARKLKRLEANELRAVNERRGFPASRKPAPATHSELDSDLLAMGLARPAPPLHSIEQEPQPSRMAGHMPPSVPISHSSMSSRHASSNRWVGSGEYLPGSNMQQPSGYYGSRPEVEIYVDGSRCLIDGIWYKPNDSVVVLDAAIGKYNAKYLFLANDEIMLQRTDGSKTRLHLSLFRGRKLCMQPKP